MVSNTVEASVSSNNVCVSKTTGEKSMGFTKFTNGVLTFTWVHYNMGLSEEGYKNSLTTVYNKRSCWAYYYLTGATARPSICNFSATRYVDKNDNVLEDTFEWYNADMLLSGGWNLIRCVRNSKTKVIHKDSNPVYAKMGINICYLGSNENTKFANCVSENLNLNK